MITTDSLGKTMNDEDLAFNLFLAAKVTVIFVVAVIYKILNYTR